MICRPGRATARAVAFVCCVWLQTIAAAADGIVSDAVRVEGQVDSPTTFTVEALTKLEAHDVSLGDGRTYRGVLLRDLVTASKPIENGRFDLRRTIVVARAADGYLAVFAWAELFNSPLGDRVVVAYQRDGAALKDDEGRIALVTAGDLRPGMRHVRWLSAIELRRIAP